MKNGRIKAIQDNRLSYRKWLEQTQNEQDILLTAEFARSEYTGLLKITGVVGDGNYSLFPYSDYLQKPEFIDGAPTLISCDLVGGEKRQAREMVRSIYFHRPLRSHDWYVRDSFNYTYGVDPNVVIMHPFSHLYRNKWRKDRVKMILPAIYAYIHKDAHKKFVTTIKNGGHYLEWVPCFHSSIIGAKDFKEEVWKLVPSLRKELRK